MKIAYYKTCVRLLPLAVVLLGFMPISPQNYGKEVERYLVTVSCDQAQAPFTFGIEAPLENKLTEEQLLRGAEKAFELYVQDEYQQCISEKPPIEIVKERIF